MPRVVPVTQATWPSRRKRSSTPGIGRGYHRARGPALARARDLARAGARRGRPHRRRFARGAARALRRRPAGLRVSRRRRASRRRCPTRPGSPCTRRRATRVLDPAHVELLPRGGRAACSGTRAAPTTASTRWPSSRHVRVTLAGETLAESTRPMVLFETDEPTRFYFAQADVRLDLLEPSETDDDVALPGHGDLVLGPHRRRAPPRRGLDVPLPDPAAAAPRRPAGVPGRPRARALTDRALEV